MTNAIANIKYNAGGAEATTGLVLGTLGSAAWYLRWLPPVLTLPVAAAGAVLLGHAYLRRDGLSQSAQGKVLPI